MSDLSNWAFPPEMQPKTDEARFDLEGALDSMVLLRAEVPEDAFTAGILGTERIGNGVVIREDGLVLTIGYLITEATTIWLNSNAGKAVAAHPLAYDQPSGFGLVQPLGKLGAPALARGTAASCRVGDEVVVAGHGGRRHALRAKLIAKREFAGYWEYVLDEALFTAPAHPHWSGAALISTAGRLVGLGSLMVQEELGGRTVQGNMMVPIDLLEPILEDLLKLGRAKRAARPWLGLYATEVKGHVVISGLAGGGPAERAGLQAGDIVIEVAGARVGGLADLFRKIWSLGAAGAEVPMTLVREGSVSRVRVPSIDRQELLKKPSLH
ncbi:MAG TPA: S1C family serine protease [Burkholderiales bacterium]|nr:S1C family serine protease [Burkholderiales bacterium]